MKQIEIHGEPRFYRRHGKDMVQVTILVGEGADRRSETRHGEFKGGWWVGLNPDRRAIPMNQQFMAELLAAKAEFTSEKATLTELNKELAKLEATEPTGDMDVAMITGYKAEIAEAIVEAQAFVGFAEAEVAEAKAKLAHVQHEVPLEVAFVGGSLGPKRAERFAVA